jgi:hypothetical protein
LSSTQPHRCHCERPVLRLVLHSLVRRRKSCARHKGSRLKETYRGTKYASEAIRVYARPRKTFSEDSGNTPSRPQIPPNPLPEVPPRMGR